MTTNRKSDKERAFLQDLFIAPDWGERFAELIDEHVKIPNEGKALYVESGTGGHAKDSRKHWSASNKRLSKMEQISESMKDSRHRT